jgi:calcineurin-like phosphoesterase family protein
LWIRLFLKNFKKIIKYEDFIYHLQFMSSEGFATENLHATLG